MCVKAPHTVTLGALYVLMALTDRISFDRREGYEDEVKSIDRHTSRWHLCVQEGTWKLLRYISFLICMCVYSGTVVKSREYIHFPGLHISRTCQTFVII